MDKQFKYDFDKDTYDTLDEFIHEYTCTDSLDGPCSYGLDFIFNNKLYRISRDQFASDDMWDIYKKHFNKRVGSYYLAISNDYVKDKNTIFSNEFHTIIGIFDDIYDLLQNGEIEGTKFSKIILDKNTKLVGKD